MSCCRLPVAGVESRARHYTTFLNRDAVVPVVASVTLLYLFPLWFAPAVTLACVLFSYLMWAALRLQRLVKELFSERERSRVTLN